MIPSERIERAILLIRGQKVMLDEDLAALYGVDTRSLVQTVRRNIDRFPADFMFRLTTEETKALRSQLVISKPSRESKPAHLRFQTGTSNPSDESKSSNLRSQTVISSAGYGGRRYPPYAFTEQGVAMLSSVLRSPRAVAVNIEIMRSFVRLRQLLSSNEDLSRKLVALERKYDGQFKAVFEAIRSLMTPASPPRRRIGFRGK
jgi:hypothetical protein